MLSIAKLLTENIICSNTIHWKYQQLFIDKHVSAYEFIITLQAS